MVEANKWEEVEWVKVEETAKEKCKWKWKEECKRNKEECKWNIENNKESGIVTNKREEKINIIKKKNHNQVKVVVTLVQILKDKKVK